MAKVKKVYLPRWQRWLGVPLFGGFWIFFTYMEFFDPNVEKLGLVGYIFISALFLGMGFVMWLMASGKLPSYIIKEEKTRNNFPLAYFINVATAHLPP